MPQRMANDFLLFLGAHQQHVFDDLGFILAFIMDHAAEVEELDV